MPLVTALETILKRVWEKANKITHNYISYLAQAFKNFTTKGTSEAVVFGYWSVFSLFPLVMLAIVAATFLLGPESAQAQVRDTLERFIPGGGATLIEANIEQAITQRSGFSVVGIIGLLYGATGLFMNLQFNMSRIFRDERQRIWPIQLGIGIVMLFALCLLVITSLVASGLFTFISGQLLGDQSPLFSLFVGLSAALLPLFIDGAMFTMLFRFIPQKKITLRALIPAVVLGALVWEASKNLFGWYVLHLANFGVMYGSLGTVIGLLTWTYLTGCIISLCAEFAVATDDWLAKRAPAVATVDAPVNVPADQLPASEPGKVAEIDQRAAEVQESAT